MEKTDISHEKSGQSNAQLSGQMSGWFSKKADRLFGVDPAGLDESARGIVVLVIVGVAVGLLSGMFGIGGGTVIVPALIIGLAAAVTAPFGTWIAGEVSPHVGSIMFACYLCVLLVRSMFVAVKATRSAHIGQVSA